jgi:hypothetical protein
MIRLVCSIALVRVAKAGSLSYLFPSRVHCGAQEPAVETGSIALIKAYDVLVKSSVDRKTLERTAPLLVAARDQAVVELKREKLAAELNQRNLRNHTVRRR